MNFRNNRWIIFIIVILTCVCTTSRSQDSLSLSQAIKIALENSLQVKQAKLNQVLAVENVRASKLALLPTLNVSTGLNYSFGRNEDPFSSEFFYTKIGSSSGGISTSMPLFQWSQRFKQISQNKYLLEVSKSSSRKIENDLVLNVITAYLQILFNKEVLNANIAQLNIARQLLDQEKKQYDIGNKTIVDLSQSQSQVASAELKLSNAKNQLQLSDLNLSNYLELPAGSEIKIATIDSGIMIKKTEYSAAQIFKSAIQISPSIRLSENQTLVAAKGVELARLALFPKLSLQLGLGTGFSTMRQRGTLNSAGQLEYSKAGFGYQVKDNLNQYIGLSLSIPVFNGMTTQMSINRAKINLQNAQIAEQVERNNLRKIISQAVLDLELSIDQFKATNAAFEASQVAFRSVEKRYNVGLVNSLTLSQAQTNRNVAEIDLIRSKYDTIFKNKVIQFYLGELVY